MQRNLCNRLAALGVTMAFVVLSAVSVAAQEPGDDAAGSPYGVCAHVARGDEHPFAQREFELMRDAGIRWVRTDFAWSGIERRRGEWDFEMTDRTVELAQRHGVTLLPILDYDVRWATPAHEHLDEWLEYVRRVVTRYKDRIRYWEVWNEPNLRQFWKDEPDPAAYVKLLKATHGVIKSIDAELIVVLGGTAGVPIDYLRGVYEAGGKDHFDVMNVHPYGYPRKPEDYLPDQLGRLKALMAKHGDAGKPIWFTEIGWPTHTARPGEDAERHRGISEAEQAKMLARAYLLSLQSGVQRVFWYEFQATEHDPHDNESHFGIVHRDLSPKPAFKAYRTLIEARPAGSKVLGGSGGQGRLKMTLWSRPDGRTVAGVWLDDGTSVEMAPNDGLERAINHLGEPLDLRPTPGAAEPTVGGGPVYLIYPKP